MISLITIAFFFLVLILPPFWAFGLSFFFGSIYFQYGNIDVSSYAFLMILLRIWISGRFDYNLVKTNSAFTFLLYFLVLSVFWSLPNINVGLENTIGIFRNLIGAYIFLWIRKYSSAQIRFLIPIILFSFFIFIFHTILLHLEIHPFFESTINFGRLRGRTITGENLNSNQASFQILSLLLILYS